MAEFDFKPKPNMGVLKQNKPNPNYPIHPKIPQYVGELIIDCEKLEQIRLDGGKIRLGAWVIGDINRDGHLITLSATWWKPPEEVDTQARVEEIDEGWEIQD